MTSKRIKNITYQYIFPHIYLLNHKKNQINQFICIMESVKLVKY